MLLSLAVSLLAGCGGDDGGESPLHAGLPLPAVEGSGAPKDTRPDIVVVVADDMRWDLMSGENHPFVRTPNLDAFAASAAKMDKAFVPVALCSPSRAAILTGRLPHLASAPGIVWRNNAFLQTQRTFAEELQEAGYTTAYIGKWHMGDGAKPKRGFDHWESFDWLGDFFDPVVHVNGVPQQYTGYADDVLSARADMFLKAYANSEKPVFLMVGLKAPHLQFEYPERHEHAFDGVGIPKPHSYDEDFSVSGKLQAVKDWLGMEVFHCGLKCFGGSWDRYIKSHFRAILGLDDSIGTLRAATRHRGKDDNTLFVYTSDNGYTLGEHGMTEKHMIYEEPIRVPFLIDFPGRDDVGFRFDGLVSTLDIAPTALDYAGVAIPDRMDGRSLRPLIDTDGASSDDSAGNGAWRDGLFLAYSGWQVGLRTDRFKYIESLQEPGHVELYDLELDPEELRSVHADPEYADQLAIMDTRLDRTIERIKWSARAQHPLQRVLVSSPLPSEAVDAVARAVSLGGVPVAGMTDVSGMKWSSVERDEKGFVVGENVPTDSSVLVVVPLERVVDFDPFVRIHIGGFEPFGTLASMYVDGAPLWDNFERRPIDFPNPPLVDTSAVVIMRLDGGSSSRMRVAMGIEVPNGTIRLPLEDRLLGDAPGDAPALR